MGSDPNEPSTQGSRALTPRKSPSVLKSSSIAKIYASYLRRETIQPRRYSKLWPLWCRARTERRDARSARRNSYQAVSQRLTSAERGRGMAGFQRARVWAQGSGGSRFCRTIWVSFICSYLLLIGKTQFAEFGELIFCQFVDGSADS